MIRLTPNGTLDTTFGTERLARIPLNTNPPGRPLRLLRQNDGKFIILYADEWESYPPLLYRLHPDASLDNTFGNNGSLSVQLNRARDIALQPAGVLVFGKNNEMNDANMVRVQRYTVANGALDLSFGESGTQAILFADAAGVTPHRPKVTDDNKIALVTTLNTPKQPDLIGVAKLTANGDIDLTFNQDGLATISPPKTFLNTTAEDILLTPDGITIVGSAEFMQSLGFSVLVAQLTPDGILDSSFGSNGFYYRDDVAHLKNGNRIILNGDGEFLIGGTRSVMAILKLKPNGAPDYTYGPQGQYTLGSTSSIAVEKIVPQDDGQLVIYSPVPGGTFLFRVHADGTRDTTYGTQGVARIPAPAQGNTGPAAVGASMDALNRLVLVGFTEIVGTTPFLSRITQDGVLDDTFGQTGHLFFGVPDQEQAHDVAIDEEGRFVVVGRLQHSGLPDDLVIRRLLTTGTSDTTFGDNGVVMLPNCSAVAPSYVELAVQSHLATMADGDLIVAAYCDRDAASVTMMIRLNSDGSFDGDFGNNGVVLVPVPFVDWVVSSAGEITLLHDGFYTDDTTWIVSRYAPNGVPDKSFGDNGQVSHLIPNIATLSPKAIVRESNGNYVLLGSEFLGTFGTFDSRVARLLPTGALDTTFGDMGLAHFDLERLEIPSDLALHDHYAIVAGPLSPNETLTFGIARFLIATSAIPTPTPTITSTPTIVPSNTPPVVSNTVLYLPLVQRENP